MVLDFRSVPLAGAEISAASVVSHGDPRVVRDLMVDGRWLMRNRTITVFDEMAIIEEAEQCAAEQREVTGSGRQRLGSLIDRYDTWSAEVFSNLDCPHCRAQGGSMLPVTSRSVGTDH